MSDEEKKEKCTKRKCWGDSAFRDDPNMILQRLKDGNKRFMTNNLERPNQSTQRRECTAYRGQRPYAIILSCADSRVPPELIFDAGISDLFVVRVAGNIANTSSIASIEFAAAVLGCEFILVLGHEGCGAVQTAIDGGKAPSKNLAHLLKHIEPAVHRCECHQSHQKSVTWRDIREECNHDAITADEKLKKVTIENAHLSVKELLKRSKILRKRKAKCKLTIHTGYYNLASGKVDFDVPSKC